MNEMVQCSAVELLTRLHSRDVSAIEVFDAHMQAIEATDTDINALSRCVLNAAPTRTGIIAVGKSNKLQI